MDRASRGAGARASHAGDQVDFRATDSLPTQGHAQNAAGLLRLFADRLRAGPHHQPPALRDAHLQPELALHEGNNVPEARAAAARLVHWPPPEGAEVGERS